MSYIEDKDVPMYFRKLEYRDIDIKSLSFIEAFVQRYMRHIVGGKFNTGIDKIGAEHWDQMISSLITVYEEKWKKVVVTDDMKGDIIERVLGKYQDSNSFESAIKKL